MVFFGEPDNVPQARFQESVSATLRACAVLAGGRDQLLARAALGHQAAGLDRPTVVMQSEGRLQARVLHPQLDLLLVDGNPAIVSHQVGPLTGLLRLCRHIRHIRHVGLLLGRRAGHFGDVRL